MEMKITSRKTHAFIEITTDEITTTIFKSDQKEVEDTINNLLDVVNDLASYTDKSVLSFVKEGGY